ncbi:hypothetical protein [Isoptericola hypogeus]
MTAEPAAAWSTSDVLAASAAWQWYPDDASVVTGDHTIVNWPDWSPQGAVVLAARPDREPAGLLDEAADAARGWGRDHLSWWVSGADNPDLEPLLRSRGAETVETVDVLARPTGSAAPADPAAAGIDVHQVTTLDHLRDADVVDVAVWDQQPMDAARLGAELDGLRPAPDGTAAALRVVAYLDGRPVATGGATVVDAPRPPLGRVARLWGAATLPSARGRGAYRAVLGERLRLASAAGATLALVKGRAETSAPILVRGGFTPYATERLLRVPL